MIFDEEIGHGRLNKPITCPTCSTVQTGRQIADNGGMCPGCDNPICCYCGCTNSRACVHSEIPGLNCSWDYNGCCSFCSQIIFEEMYLITTGRADQVLAKYEDEPVIVLATIF